MKEPKWLLPEIVIAVQKALLAEHGGGTGLRDETLFDSAMARPKQKYHYEHKSTIYELAGAYSYDLANNHPFVDGNKRIALTAGLVFLDLNGVECNAPEAEAAAIFERLAAGKVSEEELGNWFLLHSEKA